MPRHSFRRRRAARTLITCVPLLFALACGSSDSTTLATNSPDPAANTQADAGVSTDPDRPSKPASDAGADATAKPTCKKEHDTLGMACLQVNDDVCPTGDGACYPILLRNVCGPKDRACSLESPTCAGAGQTCRTPLRVGASDGICLTDDEAVCFCGNIGVSLRPSFCPIADDERPGVDDICTCPEGGKYCVSESSTGPCKPDLACINGGCRGKVCTNDAQCAANEICTAYATSGGQVLGKACRPKS